MIQAKLKLEIIAGYLLLVSFFAFIVYLVHEERERTSAMKQQELHWQKERQLTNRAFVQLLDLTATGELVAGWTEDDYVTYRNKHMEVSRLLQELKMMQEDMEQQMCVDSVCILLVEKERQMAAILNLLENMPDAGDIIRKKIPAIVRQTRQWKQEQVSSDKTTVEPLSVEKKKHGFWGFLRKKEKKSAYALQREKSEETQTVKMKVVQPPALLYSLEKEINDTTRLYEEKLSVEIDSLRIQNQKLNGRINSLIQNFENKKTETFRKEIQAQQTVRNHSFRLITGFGIGAFMMVVILYIIIHQDVNRQYRYRKELEVSNQRNMELLQSRKNILLTVNHDLRAPLGTISGYAELIPEEKDEGQRKRYAENIMRISRHVIELANNLLYYYRLESGKEQLDKEVFSPRRVIENIVLSFRPLAEKKGLGLTMEPNGTDTVVEGDRIRLTQILSNLLTNAIKFTRTGYVHIGVHYGDGQLCFFVRDTGTGISEERQKGIFNVFEKLDVEGTELGFGLGLSITAKLVALLGGSISVESQEGHGSTFDVSLPMSEAGGHDTENNTQSKYINLSGLRMVLIDDERMQADMTKRMLIRGGMLCDCCCNIKELIELLRSKHYDLLLTDMQMPEIDGYKVLALLRNSNLGQSKDIPVLAVTARAKEETARLVESGFAGCLHKPFSMDELMIAVGECVGSKIHQRADADFTALLEGEEDRKGMLEMFIQDTEKTVADLREAIGIKNYKKISALIHKSAPLWETVRIGIPMVKLERLASLMPETWDDSLLIEVKDLVEAVQLAVENAKRLWEEME